jgi:hypothetical protein
MIDGSLGLKFFIKALYCMQEKTLISQKFLKRILILLTHENVSLINQFYF